MTQENTIAALKGFLRDHENGEFEWNQVVNVFGPNEAKFLLDTIHNLSLENVKLASRVLRNDEE